MKVINSDNFFELVNSLDFYEMDCEPKNSYIKTVIKKLKNHKSIEMFMLRFGNRYCCDVGFRSICPVNKIKIVHNDYGYMGIYENKKYKKLYCKSKTITYMDVDIERNRDQDRKDEKKDLDNIVNLYQFEYPHATTYDIEKLKMDIMIVPIKERTREDYIYYNNIKNELNRRIGKI